MDCREAREVWHRACEAGGDHAALSQHLAGCDPCRRYAADMRRLTAALAELRGQTESIRSQGAALKPVATRRRLGAVLRIAALIAIITGTYIVFVSLRPSPTRPLLVESESPPPPDAIDRRREGTATPGVRQPALGLTLRGESAHTMLAVAVPATEPDVQMYWLYPTLRAEAESRGTDH